MVQDFRGKSILLWELLSCTSVSAMIYMLIRQMLGGLAYVCEAAILVEVARNSCVAQMTVQEFNRLADSDKRTVLANALQQRESALGNLQASSITRVRVVAYRDGTPGAILKEVGRYECVLRRKDGNRWTSVKWYLPNVDHPNQKVITAMDTKSGTAKSIAEQDTLKGVYGAIDVKEDMLVRAGRFNYWFDANFDKPRNFPVSFLLKNIDAVKFKEPPNNSQEIPISLQVDTDNGTPHHDTRTVWVDPQRGFMPVRMHWTWNYESTPPLDQDMVTEVSEMREFSGAWLPMHFIETVVSKRSIAEGFCTVYETTSSDVKVGEISDTDVQVRFASEVEVYDRIKGIRTKADRAIQANDAIATRPANGLTKWLISINILVLLILSTAIAVRRKRKILD